MANPNTIECYYGIGAAAPGRNQLTALSIGTAETAITIGTDTAGTTAIVSLTVPSQTKILGAGNPRNIDVNPASLVDFPSSTVQRRNVARPPFNSGSFDGRAMRLRLQGHLTTGTSTATCTIQFYQNTSAALGGTSLTSTALISTTAAATKMNFIAECVVIWDSNTLYMTPVESWCNIGGTYVARAFVVAPFALSAANFALTNFVASVTFSANASGNLFVPIEFALEQV
jgi:hypothetical protein